MRKETNKDGCISKTLENSQTEEDAFPEVDPGIELKGSRVLIQLRKEKTTIIRWNYSYTRD